MAGAAGAGAGFLNRFACFTIMNTTNLFVAIIRALGIAVEGTGLLDSAEKIPEWHDSLQNAAIRYYEASSIKRTEQADND